MHRNPSGYSEAQLRLRLSSQQRAYCHNLTLVIPVRQ